MMPNETPYTSGPKTSRRISQPRRAPEERGIERRGAMETEGGESMYREREGEQGRWREERVCIERERESKGDGGRREYV